jgi:D-alanine-D-alanine ligase
MGQRIGVLMGGLSAERPISLKTGHGVVDALRGRGHDVVEIDVGRDLPARLVAERVDVAWIALHGRFGEDGCVQGLLEIMGIPYTGSGVRASAVAMDKVATKRALASIPGIVQARDAVWSPGRPAPRDLTFPVVVKPANAGSTIGITKVDSASELAAALELAATLDATVLVEEYVHGEEITAPILDDVALPIVRILPESGFFDYAAKYTKGLTRYECPGIVAAGVGEKAQAAALAAHRALGCSGLTRSDFIVRGDGTPVFLEINTLPGMTATSLSPMAAAVVGMDYGELCERILAGAHLMRSEVKDGV